MQVLAGIGPFGPVELVVILLVLVMLFGATRLADLGGSLGKGIKEFRQNVRDDAEDQPVSTTTSTTTVVSGNGASETVAAVKCPSCGTLNAIGARHCNQCGANIATPVT